MGGDGPTIMVVKIVMMEEVHLSSNRGKSLVFGTPRKLLKLI
jgi:hypothetical protein